MHKICEICKSAPATIHLTDIKNNVKQELHMCESCADAQGVTMKKSVSLQEIFGQVNQAPSSPDANESDLSCPSCGMSWAEFRSKGRLGCPEDYHVFRTRLQPLLEDIHAGPEMHIGKQPATSDQLSARRRRQIELQRQLREAVASEKYELAATLRDQLAMLDDEA